MTSAKNARICILIGLVALVLGVMTPASAATHVNPPTITDPSPRVGDRTTEFTSEGSGFTPNSTARLEAVTPAGRPYASTYQRPTDENGNVTWQWVWEPADPDGQYTLVMVDEATGIPSNQVTLEIRPDKPTGIWPTSVEGWLALVGALVALVAAAVPVVVWLKKRRRSDSGSTAGHEQPEV